jgi:UDP-N-acetylglucosamine--N-acetylmuramyl-(pentapeptide) pyrophosphoryl-undecaprenol N-acetylglucosamine transferase
VLVLGGSQGAQFLNTSVAAVLSELAGKHPELAVLHQAGEGRVEEAASRYAGRPGVEVVPYIDDMSAALARATLVVGRAGATSIAEIAAVGVPSLLIPFPFATDNHQEWNARALERAGAAVVLLQSEFSAARFAEEVEEILFDRKRLAAMARHARLAGRPDAAVRVLECARSRWQTDARARQGGSLGCRGAA